MTRLLEAGAARNGRTTTNASSAGRASAVQPEAFAGGGRRNQAGRNIVRRLQPPLVNDCVAKEP